MNGRNLALSPLIALKWAFRRLPAKLRGRLLSVAFLGKLANRLVRLHRATYVKPPHTKVAPRFLPVAETTPAPKLPAAPAMVDVIVPVYRGLEETRACIESVLGASGVVPFRLIVINDCTPEPALQAYLHTQRDDPRLLLLENEENQGFVKSVNRGMGQSAERDVVLLNSDTVVVGNWLDRLVAHAHGADEVGTVTPFSNNATICSYPAFPVGGGMPRDETPASLDRVFARVNAGRSVELPTGIGFCMYIRRDCLNQIGLFDETAFGRGYGEENDFCLMASAKGWRHLLAADTFVYHAGERSFGEESGKAKQGASAILQRRYPKYVSLIGKHVEEDPAYPLRIAATAGRYKAGKLPVILFISHGMGGGTQRHVDDLVGHLKGEARILLLRGVQDTGGSPHAELLIVDAEHPARVTIEFPQEGDLLLQLLRAFGVSRVHIHHLIDFAVPDIHALVRKLGLPFDFTVHDHYAICPQIYLVNEQDRYCGEPDLNGCARCLERRPSRSARTILEWRKDNAWLIEEASRVICPSQDVKARLARYFQADNLMVVPHETIDLDGWPAPHVPALAAGEPLRIAILGTLVPHKGLKVVEACAALSQADNVPAEYHVVGGVKGESALGSMAAVTVTGDYDEGELPTLLQDIDPHVVWFPAQCPETFSFTLTTAINLGLPIVAPRLGAFPERLSGRPWTWLVDDYDAPDQLLALFAGMGPAHIAPRAAPPLREAPPATPGEGFYPDEYLQPADRGETRELIDLRTPGRISIMAVIDRFEDCISPCGYIRVLLPYLHPSLAKRIRLTVVRPDIVTGYRADLLLVQRIAVTEPEAIDAIMAHARQEGMRLVYDLDDDLLHLPADHPDWNTYHAKKAAVFRFLCQADFVSVSTELLKQDIESINPRTMVMPNALDDRIWNLPLGEDAAPRNTEAVRILFVGGISHRPDFAVVAGAIRRLKKEFQHAVEFVLVGGRYDNGWEQDTCTVLTHAVHVGSSYLAFVHWLREQGPFDIGIAPLVDSPFNQRKSAIKFLDYAALKLAAVCSDVEPYRHIVQHGHNGLLVGNSEASWYEALRDLIRDKALRQRLAEQAQADVVSRHCLGPQAGQRIAWLEDILRMPLVEQDACAVRDLTNGIDSAGGDSAVPAPMEALWPGARQYLAHAFLHGDGIELGALHSPLPVAPDVRVTYVDRISRETLLRHYPELNAKALVPVDRVDGDLSTFEAASQDFVIASHLLEHAEDPIAMLKAFNRVLRPGGVLFMALPDKRFSYDHTRVTTTLEHLLCDHEQGPSVSRLAHYREWAKLVEPEFGRVYATSEAVDSRANALMEMGYSIHFHTWTPSEVVELIDYCVSELRLAFFLECFLSFREEMIIIIRRQ